MRTAEVTIKLAPIQQPTGEEIAIWRDKLLDVIGQENFDSIGALYYVGGGDGVNEAIFKSRVASEELDVTLHAIAEWAKVEMGPCSVSAKDDRGARYWWD